jgi:hypothetical protein
VVAELDDRVGFTRRLYVNEGPGPEDRLVVE